MSWTVTWRAVSATQEREFANELEARAFAGVLESLAPELAIECEIAEAAADADALNVDGLRVYTDDALLDLETAAAVQDLLHGTGHFRIVQSLVLCSEA